MSADLPYRDFYYPLNVFMHILAHEEGGARSLHYGIFEREGESLLEAQERSTELVLSRLPPPPCRILEVGIGLATTFHRLLGLGYDVVGITPDQQQIAMARARYGDALPVECVAFEHYPEGAFDLLLFQESSQYIDSEALFARAAALAPRVLVLDEFSMRPLDLPGALHRFDEFLEAAARHGFEVEENVDLSRQAAPTIQYFIDRLPRYRARLIEDLALTDEQVDHLIANGVRYVERYADGTYGYRLVSLRRANTQSRHMKSSGAASSP